MPPVPRFAMLALLVWFPLVSPTESGENWPCWRGPRNDGSSLQKILPTRWDGATGSNIAWKVALEGSGHASPIVWNDRIFLVSCREDRQERLLLCFDSATGKLLWERRCPSSPAGAEAPPQ